MQPTIPLLHSCSASAAARRDPAPEHDAETISVSSLAASLWWIARLLMFASLTAPAGSLAGEIAVYRGDPGWFTYLPGTGFIGITAANPRSGNGSLELSKGSGWAGAFIREPGSPFGAYGDLSVMSFDWFTDSASTRPLPPDIALRVYPYGDPRSFFLIWTPGAGSVPTGAWQHTDAVGQLGIQQAESNAPPTSLAAIPTNAPIVGIHLRASYGLGDPWRGFVDNFMLGFRGQDTNTYNFEFLPGGSLTNTPVVPAGSVWKYLDNGSDQGTAWQAIGFDDSAWASGPAQLGYGDGDERTVVGYGPDPNFKYVTTYFRRTFTIDDPSGISGLTVRLLRDDGGVVYLNGVEVFRSNMPGGSINYLTLAATTIPNSDESVFFSTVVSPTLLLPGTNVLAVEIHQANRTSSDISFDLSLLATVASGPPVITLQPQNQIGGAGGTATFHVQATGTIPLSYQWYFNGTEIPNATSASLSLTELTTDSEGRYWVMISNSLGTVVSDKASLTLVNLTGDFFQITSLSADNAVAVEHLNLTGDDRGGIAASFSDLLVTGDGSTARFNLSDLSGGAGFGRIYDSLVSDLRSGTIYVLANGTTPLSGGGTANALLELDGASGALTGRAVALSTNIDLTGCYGCMGLFSGFGRLVVHNGTRAFTILLPSGQVLDHGPMPAPNHQYSENWAYWGVAEYFNASPWLVYVRDFQTIVRTRVPDGLTLPVATFNNLSDMASITVSPVLNRWYFHHQYTSQFRSGNETVGFADAALAHEQQPQPPAILLPPRDRRVHEGSNVTLSVLALGYPLAYQWRVNGQDITGATNQTLNLTAVSGAQVGLYSVVVGNDFGSVTSPPALLDVVTGGGGVSSVAVFGGEFNASWNEDVRRKIEGTGLFAQVDAFQVASGPAPTLAQLQQYDAVFVYSDNGFNDAVGIGNVLADYIDAGGSVVLATFVFNGQLQGRIVSAGYLPFTIAGNNAPGGLTLVADQPSHPILAAVASFNGGGSSYHNYPINLTAGAELVAHWSDGQPLIATKEQANGRVVGLNFFPPSSEVRSDLWDARTDGAFLMANALLWAGGGGGTTVPGVAPGIRTQPASLSVLEGLDARFTLTSYGSAPLAYQWFFNDTPLAGATNRALLLTNVHTNQSGSYHVVITNAYGAVTSEVATLTVQPTRGVVGYYTDFNTSSTGLVQSIVSALFTPLRIDNISTFDFTRLNVLLIDETSDRPSPELRRRLPDLQEWVSQGGRAVVHERYVDTTEGLTANPFLLGVHGVAFTSYYSTDIDVVPPATNLVVAGPHGTLNNTSLDGFEINYTAFATRSTLPPGTTAFLCTGGNSSQVLAFAYGLGAGLIYYSTIPLDWYLDYSTSPVGSLMRTVYAPNVLEYAVAYASTGRPVILAQPDNVVAPVGTTAAFFVAAQGQAPLQYQWRLNGAPLPGATNNPLRLTGVSSADNGTYSVIVSNALGFVTSLGALLTVVPRLSVGVFADPRYVYTGGNVPLDNVQATIQQLGHIVRPFTNLLTAVTNDVLLFPEFGNRALAPDLDDSSRALLRAYVAQGGLLVAQAGYANVDFLNTVFEMSLAPNGCFTGLDFFRSPQAAGTPFAGGPTSIPANYCTYTLGTGSWPPGSLPLYTNQFYGSTVTLIPYGAGTLVHLGWNWNDAAPVGTQDGGWSAVLANALQARGVVTAPPVAITPLVPAGSDWRYLDNGSDQGTAWRGTNFDDSGWALGFAQLGYGDGDEATVVSFGPDPNNKFVTTYFRRSFSVTNASAISNLTLRLLRDDGAAVYLNGVEIVRNCLDTGAGYNTYAYCTISGTDENLWLSFPVNSSLLRSGANLLAVEIHQANGTSSDISFDLELTGLIPVTAPVIRTQPTGHVVLEGGTVVLSTVAAGSLPLSYQWRLNDHDLPGATNAILVLSGITSGQSGSYSVAVTNQFGAVVSSNALVSVVPLSGDTFRISSLSTNNAGVVDDSPYAGDDRGGIATSAEEVFYNGDNGTARFALADLSGGTNVGFLYDALVSDLRTETVYSLANGTNALASGGGIVTALLVLDGVTGQWTGASLGLSQPIDLQNKYGQVGLFAGLGRVVVHDGTRAWSIDLPSGLVVELGTVAVPQHAYTENWAYWGVAEFFDGAIWLVYVRDSQAIVRTRVSDGYTETVRTFDSLSDMASITVSLPYNRWYFHHQSSSQFSTFYETTGFADAAFVSSMPATAPTIVRQPAGQNIAASGTAALRVVARGTGPLRYQWLFEGTGLPDATNATLVLGQVTTNQSGRYAVVVSNAAGSVQSSDALVTVEVLGGDTLRITSLSTNNATVADHDALTGGARAGIAASARRVFYSGNSAAAGFNLTDLSGGTNVGRVYDGLVSELGSETVYVLGHGTDVITSSGGAVTTLLEVDGLTGDLTGASIPLSRPIELGTQYGQVGIFAGLGRIVLLGGLQAHSIEMPSGRVLALGPMSVPPHVNADIGAWWGVAEFFGGSIWLAYVRDSQTIVRTRVPDGLTETVATFDNLADMPAMTVSLPLSRWYFHHRYSSQFSSFYEAIGYADATFDSSVPPVAPSIAKPPADETIAVSGTATFHVTVRGTRPLHYQWLFENAPLAGALNATLTLNAVSTNRAGHYAVVVSNAVGSVTSAVAVLRVIPSVSVAVFDDPAFVYTGGGAYDQSDGVQASLRRLGHRVGTFTSISQTAGGSAPMLFPALEAGDLASTLTQATRDALQSFVARGGVLIVHGANNDVSRAPRLLNAVFGYSVQGSYWGLPFGRTTQATDTAFADDPDYLPANAYGSSLQTSSLPPGARSVCANADQTAVALFPFGSGKIIFLGWNWSDAVPLGRQDGGWLTVLGSAVEETAPPPPSAPMILTQPQGGVALIGGTVQLRVVAAGFPLFYQWRFNGQPLVGATNYLLQLSGVTTNRAGVYSVVVSNTLGSVTSADALVSVVAPLTVAVFDDSRYVDTTSGGSSAESDNVQATLRQLGHTVSTFTTITAALNNQVLLFPEFEVGDPTPSLDSPTRAALQNYVWQGGLVIVQYGGYPALNFLNTVFGLSLYSSGGSSFSRTAQAAGTPFADDPPSLPWNDATTPLATASLPFGARNLYGDANASAIALIPFGGGNIVFMGWDWWNAVPIGSLDNGWVETLGSAVLVRVAPPTLPPVITLQPQDQSVLAGQDVTFAIGAYGSAPLQLRWFYNGQPLSGATNYALVMAAVTTGQGGDYYAVISNPAGSATSRVARLVVRASRGTIGYFSDYNPSLTGPAGPIQQASFTPLPIADISSYDLTRLSMLMIDETSGGLPSLALLGRLPDIEAWVTDGGKLIVHDRSVTPVADQPNPLLVGAGGTVLTYSPGDDLEILPPGDNLVVTGPYGPLDGAALDGAGSSYNGYAQRATLPPRALPILGAGSNTNWVVAFSYALGAGSVYYAAMPLDYFLEACCSPVWSRFKTNYTPNVIEHAAVFAVTGPPLLLTQPRDAGALAGGTASFRVSANGSAPLFYQWLFNAALIPGGTNAILLLSDITTNQVGAYQVIVSNGLGTVTSAVARVSVIQPAPFRISALTANNSAVVDHEAVTGDDRGGIGLSATHVYYTGDNSTARFSATNLSGGTSLAQRYDALVSDLRTETLYTLASDAGLIGGPAGSVTALIEINGSTGDLTGNRLALSAPIPLGADTGIFASYGAVVLHTGGRVYRIELPSGLVSDLGAMTPFVHFGCENWAYWGVAEFYGGSVYLDYVRDSQSIARTRVPDGLTTNLATFSNLGDMCSFTVSIPRSRWYFHYEGSAQFGGTAETLGYATASIDRPPRVTLVVTNRIVNEDTSPGALPFTVQDETPPNQLIVTARSSNPILLPEANIVLAGTNTSRTITLTPAPDQFGIAEITLTATDGLGQSANRTFTLTVTPVNDPPSFTKGNDVSVLDDAGPQSVSHWASAIVPGPPNEASQMLTFLVTNDSPSLFLVQPAVTPDGTLRFTPASDANGAALVTVVLQDNGGTNNGGLDTSAPQTFRITVQPANHPPVAQAQTLTLSEDSPRAITLTGTDVDGDPLTFSIVTPPTHGTLAGSGANRTYQPATNFNGADSFTFKVNDGQLDSAPASVTLTVTPVNDPPVANSQSLTNYEDTAIAIILTGSDVEGDPLTFSIVTPPAHGTLTGSGANRTYQPATNFNGADSFTFKVNDGQLDSAPASVTITVTPVNDPPVANSQSLTNYEDLPIAVTLTGSDVEGDTLTFSIATPPVHGTLTGSGANRTYQPNTNFNGADSFAFRVSDGQSNSATATVNLVILPVNDPPRFTRGADQTVLEDAGPQAIPSWAANVSAGPADESGQTLTFEVVNDTPSLFAAPPAIAPNGTLTFTPAPDANGIATVTVRLHDNGGTAHGGADTSPPQTFLITVQPVNDPPVANPQSLTVPEDGSLPISLTGSDVDGDPLTFSIVTPPARGTLSGTAPNLTYTPAPNDDSPDSFSFRVNDGHMDSAPALVSIRVLPVNDPPVAMIMVAPLVFLTPGATDGVVISSNNSDALVILDGSRSWDVDNDPLSYAWFDGALPAPVGWGAVISNRFNLGTHDLRLVVNDGNATGTAELAVRVVGPADAVAEVSRFLNDSTLSLIRKRPLSTTLDAAIASVARGDFTPGLNQLTAFQNKVRAQVAPEDPSLADSLVQAVQRILDAWTNAPRATKSASAPRLTSTARRPGSPFRFGLTGEPGRSYAIQVSSDLVHWTTWTNVIGATGTNQFTDPAANLNRRFYRAVTP